MVGTAVVCVGQGVKLLRSGVVAGVDAIEGVSAAGAGGDALVVCLDMASSDADAAVW